MYGRPEAGKNNMINSGKQGWTGTETFQGIKLNPADEGHAMCCYLQLFMELCKNGHGLD